MPWYDVLDSPTVTDDYVNAYKRYHVHMLIAVQVTKIGDISALLCICYRVSHYFEKGGKV